MRKTHLIIPLIIFFFLATPILAESTQELAAPAPQATVPTVTPEKVKTKGRVNGLITMDFTNADIHTVLKVLAMKGNVNIVASPDVVGVVTISLKDVKWKNAFETILSTYGYVYERDGNIYQVFSTAKLQEKQLEGLRSEVVTLEYATLDQVKAALEKVLSPVGQIESIQGTNQVVISDTPSKLKRAINLIESIDIKQPQVLVDARIIRTALTEGESLGLDWSIIAKASGARRPWNFPFTRDSNSFLDSHLKKARLFPSGQTETLNTTTDTATGATATSEEVDFPVQFGFPYTLAEDFTMGTLDFSQMSVVFNMLKSRKNTKIISNPRILTLNHQSAVV